MKAAIRWAIVVVLVGVAGFFGYRYYVRRGPAPVQYQTVKVERGRMVATVTATGTLSALVTVQVGTQVSGRLTEIRVDFNSVVKKGQVLAKLDPQIFQATVASASANLMAARGALTKSEAQVVNARAQYERAKAMVAGQIGNQADLDIAQAAYESSRADVIASKGGVAQALASLHQAEINLAFTTIVSPVDGVVISRSVDVGQTVAASLSAPTLFTIAGNLREMQVDSNVAESDVGKLRADTAAVFTVDAFPGEQFRGTVRQIRNSPVSVQNVVTYDAVIDVKNADLALKPGMTANVKFVYAERDAALRVPNAALRFKPPPEAAVGSSSAAGSSSGAPSGDAAPRKRRQRDASPDAAAPVGSASRVKIAGAFERTVWAQRGGALVKIPVSIGITDGATTEITGGDLQEGDQVVVDVVQPGGSSSPTPTGTGAKAPPMGRIL